MIKLNIKRFGSTNKTTNYELSQFVSSDKPSWLNDINSDMSKIDTAIHTAKTTADGAATAASNAATAAEGAQTTANTAVTNAATADGKATTANTNIGTLANLTTTEKTSLVGAINEVNGKEYIVNAQSTATNKAYSADFSDSRYKLKHEHAEREVFSGTASDGQDCILADNKTWADYGIFSFLVIETQTTGGTYSSFILSYDALSAGTDLYAGKRNNAIRVPIAVDTVVQAAFITANGIKANSIAFGNIGSDNQIKKIYIVE